MHDGGYLLRAEIPGFDPAGDLDIAVRDGQLTITAERGKKRSGHQHLVVCPAIN